MFFTRAMTRNVMTRNVTNAMTRNAINIKLKYNNANNKITYNDNKDNYLMRLRSYTRVHQTLTSKPTSTPYSRATPTPAKRLNTQVTRRYAKPDVIETLRKRVDRDTNIEYLKKRNVLEWLFGDHKFVSKLTKKQEDIWGKRTIGYETNQWTTKLGESILREILYLLGKNPTRVKVPQTGMNRKRLLPDFEGDDGMYENKARTYTTSGTAGEKILGTPLKYCEIPRLYGKPLYIVCMAFQEVEADTSFHLFDPMSEELVDILDDLDKRWSIKYVRATELLRQIARDSKK